MSWPVLLSRIIIRVFFLVVLIMAMTGPTAPAQTQESRRDLSPAMDQPQAAPVRPMARGWKIAIVAIVAMGTGFALAFSMRAWRSSNLFDRQYRFPAVTTVELRLGANKSGGGMATIEFGHRRE
jgi:hypothetical protein